MSEQDVIRDARGRWCLAVPRDPGTYASVHALRVLRRIPGVPASAGRAEAMEAAGRMLAAERGE